MPFLFSFEFAYYLLNENEHRGIEKEMLHHGGCREKDGQEECNGAQLH